MTCLPLEQRIRNRGCSRQLFGDGAGGVAICCSSRLLTSIQATIGTPCPNPTTKRRDALSPPCQAVKAGGANEETNKVLADTIREAKRVNVPKDNIARAIKRAVDGSQGDFKEAVYEVGRTCGVSSV